VSDTNNDGVEVSCDGLVDGVEVFAKVGNIEGNANGVKVGVIGADGVIEGILD